MAIIDINNVSDGTYTDPDTGVSTTVTQTGGDDNTLSVLGLTDAMGLGSNNPGFTNSVIEAYQYDFSNPVETVIVQFAVDNRGETFQVIIDGNPYPVSLSEISPNTGLTINGSGQIVSTGGGSLIETHTLTITVPTGISSFSIGNTVATGAGVIADVFIEGILCFARGTLIKTPQGEVPVEQLSVDDMVLTMDSGYQPIRWIGSNKKTKAELEANTKLKPIRIRAGALGAGLPEQDLVVSPQHRVLVRSAVAERMFGEHEVLIPANKLLALDGIEVDDVAEDVEYWHFLFDAHQIVWSNGTPTESLFTGPEALKAVSPEARAEIKTLFPHICTPEFEPVAARFIPEKGRQMKKLVHRHHMNQKPMLEMHVG